MQSLETSLCSTNMAFYKITALQHPTLAASPHQQLHLKLVVGVVPRLLRPLCLLLVRSALRVARSPSHALRLLEHLVARRWCRLRRMVQVCVRGVWVSMPVPMPVRRLLGVSITAVLPLARQVVVRARLNASDRPHVPAHRCLDPHRRAISRLSSNPPQLLSTISPNPTLKEPPNHVPYTNKCLLTCWLGT